MEGNLNPRVVGACVVGFALVAGAYLLSSFSLTPNLPQPATVSEANTTARVAIAVVDQDQNGIEDWRDTFIDAEPIVVAPTPVDTTYTPPTTLTGQLGVNFMESYLRSKTYGSFGRSQEELVSDTVKVLKAETALQLYDTPDITVIRNWEEGDILTYANTIALAITNNNLTNSAGELFILSDVLEQDDSTRLAELQAIANTYQAMRDQTIATPVPAFLVKEHLDLINTYNAIYNDITAMTESISDPAFSLMRLKRYEDDASGLGYALTNMYRALLPHASLLGPEDPALLFVAFSPDFTS